MKSFLSQRQVGGALRIGEHPDLKHALRGFMGELAIYPAALSEEQVVVRSPPR